MRITSDTNIIGLISSLERKNGLTGSIDNNEINLGRTESSVFFQDESTFRGPITGCSTLNMSGVSTFNNDVRLTNVYSLLDATNINQTGNDYTINIVANKINIGNDFSEVKLNGTTTYVFTNELVVEDPLLSLNFSTGSILGTKSSGFETYSNSSIVGYIKTNPTQDKYWIKAQNTTTMFVATTDLDNNFTAAARLNVSGISTLNGATTMLSTLHVKDDLNAYRVKQAYSLGPAYSFALLIPAGCIMQYAGPSLPDGWLWCDGVGGYNGSAGQLYEALWNAIGNTYGGTQSSFNVPDIKGRVPVGVGSGAGLTNRTLGTKSGFETHTLTVTEMPSHAHTVTQSPHFHTGTTDSDGIHNHTATDSGHTHAMQTETVESGTGSVVANNDEGTGGIAGSTGYANITIGNSGAHTHGFTTSSNNAIITIDNNGSGQSHNIMQPYIVLNFIIKF